MPASSHRRTRTPGFLSAMRPKNIHALFGAPSAAEEPLFGDDAAGDDDALGVEALAPPLPSPASPMNGESSERLAQAITELRRVSERLGGELGSTALEIGCLLARRIIEAELKSDTELRTALIRAAVRRLGEVQRVTVRLCATDREAVASLAGEGPVGEALGLPIASVDLVTDTNLSPGDAIVESDTGIVDGRLGTRLEELRRVLAPVMNPKDGETS